MDKEILTSCIGAAVTVVANNGNMTNKHPDHSNAMIVKTAFDLHDMFLVEIAKRERPMKTREKDV